MPVQSTNSPCDDTVQEQRWHTVSSAIPGQAKQSTIVLSTVQRANVYDNDTLGQIYKVYFLEETTS